MSIASASLFLATAAVGVIVSYDQSAARLKFALLGAGGLLAVAVVAGARRRPEPALRLAGCACGLAAFAVAIGGIAMGRGDPGSAAGALMVLTPLAACGLGPAARGQWRWGRALSALAIAVGVAALVGSGEGTAIAALAVGALVGSWASWRSDRTLSRWGGVGVADAIAVLGFTLGLAAYLSLILSPAFRETLGRVAGRAAMSRPELWQDSLVVLRDYSFTGAGLGETAMVLSSYLWLLHVPFHPHVHNLYLQVGLEQGVGGLIAIVGMVLAAAWSVALACRVRDPRVRRVGWATATTLSALGFYGLVESDLYDAGLVWCLPLPFGFAAALGAYRPMKRAPSAGPPSRTRRAPALLGLAAAGLAAVVVGHRGVRAQMHANLGALAQTRAELGIYRWPQWPIQDALRRRHPEVVAPASEHYRAALAVDPTNETANRRLGQILLSLGQYRDALEHLESALAVAPSARVTQQLLGEAYAVTGQTDAAVSLWSRAGARHDALDARLWWYQHVGDDVEVNRLRQAIERFEARR